MTLRDYFNRENIPRHQEPIDLSAWPEDVRPTLGILWEVWGLKPPQRQRKRGGEFAAWIEETRALDDACAEFPAREVLEELFVDYNVAIRQGRDVVTLGRPQAFVRYARDKTARWRTKDQGEEAYRKRYLKGELADSNET